MVFKIIIATLLFIAFILSMYNTWVGIRKNDDKLTVLCSIASGLIGLLFGISLCVVLFNI